MWWVPFIIMPSSCRRRPVEATDDDETFMQLEGIVVSIAGCAGHTCVRHTSHSSCLIHSCNGPVFWMSSRALKGVGIFCSTLPGWS